MFGLKRRFVRLLIELAVGIGIGVALWFDTRSIFVLAVPLVFLVVCELANGVFQRKATDDVQPASLFADPFPAADDVPAGRPRPSDFDPLQWHPAPPPPVPAAVPVLPPASTRKFLARNRPPRNRGTILWNPPHEMRVARSARVEVRIGDADVALERLYDSLSGRGVELIDELEVAPLMRVVVTGDRADFAIRSLSTTDQLVRAEEVARWDFDVTPRRGGVRKLRLLASMRVQFEGKEQIVDLPSYESEVRVAVAPILAVGAFCGKNWKWIAGTVAIPVIVWIGTGTGLSDAIVDEVRSWLHLG